MRVQISYQGIFWPVIFIILFIPSFLNAQEVRHNTLFGWEENTRTMILDRYHNYEGIFYDRGLFRFITPSMTKEHDLDLITYQFTGVENHSWYYDPQNSFRTYFGSFNLGMFLHAAQVRNYIPVSDNLTIPLRVTRRFDMRSDRALLQMGLDYNLSGNHNLGFDHTLTQQKPDLDATFYYRYGEFTSGAVQLEVTALDWANNSAYELSQRRGTDAPELRKYEVQPWFFSFRATTPQSVYEAFNLRGELMGGVQTPLVAISELGELDGEEFRDRELARYLGVMGEYAIPGFTFGVSFTQTYARFHRTNAEVILGQEAVDYGNIQIQSRLGGFLSASYGPFYIDNWIWYNFNRDQEFDIHDRYSDIRPEVQYAPFLFRENRWQMKNRAGYNPTGTGFTAAIEWSADYRDYLEGARQTDVGTVYAFDYRQIYPYQLSRQNERLTFIFGYRFSDLAYLELGASYDVDGDRYGSYYDNRIHDHEPFDGGFGRLTLSW